MKPIEIEAEINTRWRALMRPFKPFQLHQKGDALEAKNRIHVGKLHRGGKEWKLRHRQEINQATERYLAKGGRISEQPPAGNGDGGWSACPILEKLIP